MGIITGIDLVKIKEFERNLKLGKDGFKKRVFTYSEIKQNPRTESLAGIFAAKEATIKAIDKKVDWKKIEVKKKTSGKPTIESSLFINLASWDISISHNGNYVTAIFTAITND